MTAPARHPGTVHVMISDRIRADHDLVAGLVAAGFAETRAGDVEVHVKAAPVTVTRWVVACRAGCDREANYDPGGAHAGHCARSRPRAQRLAGDPTVHDPPRQQRVGVPYAYHGRAYPEVPAVANTAPGTRYLVTLRMPADPPATADTHPRVSRYTRYATAPAVTLANWHEEVIHLAAHEACHTTQFRHHQPRSEIEAETYAHARLARWRTAVEVAGPTQAAATAELHGVG